MSSDGMTVLGLKEVDRMLTRIDRRCTKERQTHVMAAAKPALTDPIKADAAKSPGRAGYRLARAVSVRKGKAGAVLVGPRTGKRTSKSGAWFRAIFMVGSPRHEVGGAKAGGLKVYASGRARNLTGRGRVFMGNVAAGVHATGPWAVKPIAANPFVRTGTERGQPVFIKALSAALFSKEDK